MIGADPIRARKRGLRRFLRREDGTALVEFGISLPTILIILFAIIETSRMLFAYQVAVGGVRDAARYFGRAIPADLCEKADPANAWTNWKSTADFDGKSFETFVFDHINEDLNRSVFPSATALQNPIGITLTCFTLAEEVGVIEVAANVRIDFPFGSIFSLFGSALGGFTTTIADTSRVLGS